MEVKIDMNYNQILKLIRKLPKKDIEKLTKTLQTDISSGKSEKSLAELILKAPTWTDSDMEDFKRARNHINKSRVA